MFGVDLVKTQIRIASGAHLRDLGLDRPSAPRGAAIQCRVNMEKMTADGGAHPTGGTLTSFVPPAGPGIRVDTFGYVGYRTSPRYDSLLAKVIAYSPEGMSDAIRRGRRALEEFRIEGLETNIQVLRAITENKDFLADRVSTTFMESHIGDLLAAATRYEKTHGPGKKARDVREIDPLGVFDASAAIVTDAAGGRRAAPTPDGLVPLPAPLQGTIVACSVTRGERVSAGQEVLIIESMKMEHLISMPVAGVIEDILVTPGDTVFEGEVLLHVAPSDDVGAGAEVARAVDLDHIRGDLAEALARRSELLDENRPDAIARRRVTCVKGELRGAA